MSLDAMTWAFKQDLPCAQKFVLVALADHANVSGKCWPSQKLLAQKCGLTRPGVNRILRDLDASGHVTKSTRKREDGANSSCNYQLNMEPTEADRVVTQPDTPPVEGDDNIEPLDINPQLTTPPKGVPPRGTRLSEDWQPDNDGLNYATERGLDILETLTDFRLYWLARAGAGATKTDWGLTWMSWCRKQQKWDMEGKRDAPTSNFDRFVAANADTLAGPD